MIVKQAYIRLLRGIFKGEHICCIIEEQQKR